MEGASELEPAGAGVRAAAGSSNYCDFLFFFFFFFFLFNLAYLLFLSGQNAQLCSSHGVRYKGPQLERKPCGPKPPTTVLPAIPKLKPSDRARQRKNPRRVLWVETTRR